MDSSLQCRLYTVACWLAMDSRRLLFLKQCEKEDLLWGRGDSFWLFRMNRLAVMVFGGDPMVVRHCTHWSALHCALAAPVDCADRCCSNDFIRALSDCHYLFFIVCCISSEINGKLGKGVNEQQRRRWLCSQSQHSSSTCVEEKRWDEKKVFSTGKCVCVCV